MFSVFIIIVMILASSLCMYTVEHNAQPEVFENAFSGIWWAMSSLLTVGCGDIYPVTTLGKLIGIVIAFLGAEALKDSTHIDLKEIVLLKQNPWNGMAIRDLDIYRQTRIVMVKRNGTMLVPKGSLVLLEGDQVVLYTQEKLTNANRIDL